MAVGGSIESVSLAGRIFSVAADADSNRKLGGKENELQMNGDGTARIIQTNVPWGLSDITVAIDDDAGDHEFLQNLSDSANFFVVTITYASGKTYQGSGKIIGELQVSSQNTTAAFSLQGAGNLTPQ